MLITCQSNFSWMTCGAENRVRDASEIGAFSLLVTHENVFVLTNNIEAPRIREEVLPDSSFEIIESDWFAFDPLSQVKKLCPEGTVLSDTHQPGLDNAAEDISPLRYALDEAEQKTYQDLGKAASSVFAAAAGTVKPGMRETEIAGILCKHIRAAGTFPVVVLVGTDQRIHNYRHPIPTEKPLNKHLMMVHCIRLRGLILSSARRMYFGPLPDHLRR